MHNLIKTSTGRRQTSWLQSNHWRLPLYSGHFLVDSPYIYSCFNLSTTAIFLCPQGGRCKEVQLYIKAWPRGWTGTPKKSGTLTQDLPSDALATQPLLCSSVLPFSCEQRRLARDRQGVRNTLDAESIFFRCACAATHAHPAHVFVCMKERKIGHLRVTQASVSKRG